MSYTVLARKYRPQTFADLVGQEHVSRTIGNAIAGGRVAHAFLFTGARGVGKTTTARLLAKSLNCEKGPSAEPCNDCDPCRDITTGSDLDVLEIDGASNNSVDDVRRLQETLPFRPARDRFKVVIVDEVHMLSTGAFNAFLKTLEEPPSHVKFIFATTEVHKVPVTIRSRCQRYDFRLIPHAVVAARVREILNRESIQADDAAIQIVAREAAGSMRDALTVLDQLLALGGDGLRGEDVARGLGIASRKHVFVTVDAMLNGDAATCLRTVSDVGEQGLDMLHFARQLLECARDLVVLRVLGDSDELVELAADERAEAERIANSKSPQELERAFSGIGKLVEEVGHSGSPQITLEMGLVRLADRAPLLELRELIDRMKALEERLGGPPGPGGAGGDRRFGAPERGGPSAGAARGAAGSGPSAVGPRAEPTARAQAAARAEIALKREPSRPPLAAAMSSAASAERIAPLQPMAAAGPAVALAAVAAVATVAASAVVANPAAAVALEVSAPPAPAEPTPAAEPAPAPAAEPAREYSGLAHTDLPAAWLRIVGQLKASQPALGAVLEHGVPLEVSARVLRIGFPEGSFFGRQAQAPAAREAILRMAEQVLGARPELQIAGAGGGGGQTKVATLAEAEQESRKARAAERREAALSHPRVREALEVFGESESDVEVLVDPE
jgi:DNA polymerase-3 subunit gamma/tau